MDIERDIEGYFKTKVRRAGAWPIKLAAPSCAGIPDRLVLWPGGQVSFVELKRPGGKPRPLQSAQMHRLTEMGFDAVVLSTREQVDTYIELYGPGGVLGGVAL